MIADLLDAARALQPDTVALRRDLHRHPEIGNDLPRTQGAVLDAIGDLGFDVRTGTRVTSVTATLDTGRPGGTMLLRGDMDALPMPEDTDLDYASEVDGAIHACGHDAHTAMLASAARLLADRADDLTGKVVFMFQPGEEGHHGARHMLEEGLLDGLHVTRAFAIHQSPIRAVSEHTRALVHAELERIATNIAAAHDMEVRFRIDDGFPVTVNDADAAAWVGDVARHIVSPDLVVDMPNPVMGAEDWSYVLQQVPGAMAFLGTCPPGVSFHQAAPNHSNRMVIDEDAMAVGVALYAATALDELAPTG